MQLAQVTVVGLGIMGGSIARHLAEAGLEVFGVDPSATARATAQDHGVQVFADLAGLGSGPGPLILSLPDVSAAAAVAKILEKQLPARTIIETSTLALREKFALRDLLHSAGHCMLDCPISGTGGQMQRKDVVIYASGDAGVLTQVQPLLELFSKQVLQLGEFGNGTRMKLIANHLVAVHNVAAAEAVLLGERAGFSIDTLLAAIAPGAGNSRMFELRGPNVAERRYEPAAMKLSLWAKDMQLIDDFAQELGAATPLFAAVSPLYAKALAGGRGDQDTSAVAEVLRERADTRVAGGNSNREE